MNTVLAKKQPALDDFIDRVRRANIGDNIVKMILYGSVLRGDATPESDIDLFVIATGDLRAVEQTADDIAFEVMLEHDERVSPIVYCVDVLRHPPSYFAYRVVKQGKEVYTVDEERLRHSESMGYLELAIEYRRQSRNSLNASDYRLAIDGAYNYERHITLGEDDPREMLALADRFIAALSAELGV